MSFKVRFVSSLAKIFPDKMPTNSIKKGTALRNEVFAFQAAYYSDILWADIEISVKSPIADYITVRQVELVPVDYVPTLVDKDALLTKPGMAPDLLSPLWENRVMTAPGQWASLWISVAVPDNAEAGIFPIEIGFSRIIENGRRQKLAVRKFELEIMDASLGEQTLKVTHWFHSDCLASHYKCDIFSEKYWQLCENFFKSAVAHGTNTLLTPIFTPPLDTQIGGERPTVQLVKVYRKNNQYSFDFTLFKRWVALAQKCGFKNFEMSHLFTQWGASAAPKIIAETENGTEKIFGWDVAADDPSYGEFLKSFLPALLDFIKELKIENNVYFHCSDEPNMKQYESYRFAVELVRKYLGNNKILDAVSEAEFFKTGVVDIPVVCEKYFNDFENLELPERWVYYCCVPAAVCPIRFIHSPSCRNRALGFLMYYHRIDGFLHWGFNFYYSRYSRFPIDPFATTTSHHGFPGGDAYLVYPGEDGTPLESLRHEVFREGLQDMRMCRLLEKYYSRAEIEAVISSFARGGRIVSFNKYPSTEKAVLSLRDKLNSMLREKL